MSFQDHLQKMSTQVEGLSGVAISDMDGIIVDQHKTDASLDMPMLVAEYSRFWPVVDQAASSCELGASEELCILGERFNVVIRKVSQDYFLLLVILAEKGLGKGRFYAKMSVDPLREEIEV